MTKSQQAVQAAQVEVKRLWNLMCEYEGISPTSKFVSFSDRNPFSTQYSYAMQNFQAASRREKVNATRRARHEAMLACGMKRVKGNLGGTYYE
jgi:hypothetical protein